MGLSTVFREEYQLVVGRKMGNFFNGYGISHNLGSPGSVDFDWKTVYKYEDDPTWDVIGFWHSHPPGIGTSPSTTDFNTMDGWVNALGRPLLCAISCGPRIAGWWFTEKDEEGRCVTLVDENGNPILFEKIGRFFFGKIPDFEW